MPHTHVTPELLEAVERGDLPAKVLTEVGWSHLMEHCPTCQEGFQTWQRMRWGRKANAEAVMRALPEVLKRHAQEAEERQKEAAKDLRVLLKLPHALRILRVQRSSSRFRGVLLAHMLLNEARKNLPAQMPKVYELAETAEEVLFRTPNTIGYYDALARARAFRANALRAQGRLQEADERIGNARSLLQSEPVTANTIYAEVDWFEGILRKDQRRFTEAEGLLRRSAIRFQRAGESIAAARPLLSLGLMYYDRQEAVKAIETTEDALQDLSPEIEPRLYLAGRHNLALFLTDLGRLEEAERLLVTDEELYQRFTDPWTRLRLAWLRGKIAFGTSRLEDAEESFLAVRAGFVKQGIGYDAAMVSLDLALVYLQQGRTAEVRQLAEEMHALFEAEDVHREAVAALLLFQEAARQEAAEAATVELVQDLTSYLKRARGNPEMRFRG